MLLRMTISVWLLCVAFSLSAEASRSVLAAFRGQLVVSRDELPVGKNDKDTIAKIKATRLGEVTGEHRDNVRYWSFRYTAFLTHAGNRQLRLLFRGHRVAPSKTLDGIDSHAGMLEGEISINEDEGIVAGETYRVELVGAKGQVVATCSLKFR